MHQVVQEAKGKGRATLLRGSAGSSHVACLLGLTDCNPLPLHYCCPQCIWFPELHAASGYDLPEMACPKCGSPMKGDGHHIPLEAFVGPDGTLPRNLYLAVSREFWETANRLLQQGSVPEPAVMKPDSPLGIRLLKWDHMSCLERIHPPGSHSDERLGCMNRWRFMRRC